MITSSIESGGQHPRYTMQQRDTCTPTTQLSSGAASSTQPNRWPNSCTRWTVRYEIFTATGMRAFSPSSECSRSTTYNDEQVHDECTSPDIRHQVLCWCINITRSPYNVAQTGWSGHSVCQCAGPTNTDNLHSGEACCLFFSSYGGSCKPRSCCCYCWPNEPQEHHLLVGQPTIGPLPQPTEPSSSTGLEN